MTGDQIRQGFLDFFRGHGHTIVPSAPLVPQNDPSLLFTNAGMVPFKHVFLGTETRPYVRAADTQKCLRISGKHNDLEQVGRDTYHHTFFEMLGNWSFGDYYKREAITWAWELLTKIWKLPKDKLYATVYTTDDEADALWREVTDIGRDRISRFEKENFWEMADTGPCGPCTEIHVDRGPEACDHPGRPHRCQVNGDCARYMEIWNLVFIQNNRDASGTLSELPAKHVDTGMGFERIAAVIQNVPSNYDIDVFQTIIRREERLAGKRYRANDKDDVSLRVIADHARAVTFLVADGILPSNEGRGYVLRRLLRRAGRHGKLLGMDRPFLHEVVDGVVEAMGAAFPEIVAEHGRIKEAVLGEEERFAQTLDRGLALLAAEIEETRRQNAPALSGEVAFRLYDTFGFPLDLTEDILAGEGLVVDKEAFERAMGAQRDRARGAQKFVDASAGPALAGLGARVPRFVGDRVVECDSEVLALVADGVETRGPVREGAHVDVVTAETPFYAESGGQVGDRGWITTGGGTRIEVTDTQKIGSGIVAHRGVVRTGGVAVGDRVTLAIDADRREAARLNHSATHLAHGALRRRLGTHVKQAGSLVDATKLRFDFSHHKAVSPADLRAIEDEVNAEIRANVEVTSEEMSYDDAIKAGALAFFGDKYGDRVRVVRMGEFSTELCGGTHVARTGDIGLFKIDAESGVAAGVRRLEAVTGAGALDEIRRHEATLGEIAALLKTREPEARGKLEKLLGQQRELEKRVQELQAKLAGGATRDVMADARQVNGVTVLATKVEGLDDKGLRELADRLRDRIKSGIVVLAAAQGERAMLLAAVTKDLVGRYHAGDIIKRLAPIVGGGGGGRPDFAQAGGKDPSQLDAAVAAAFELVGTGDLAVAEPAAVAPTLRFPDPKHFRTLLGQQDENIRIVERALDVRIAVGDGTLAVEGDAVETELAGRVLEQLYGLIEQGYPIYASDVDYAIRILSGDRSARLRDIFLDTVFISASRNTITPKSVAQKAYIDAIRHYDIVFGIGPAGTGKTYLAMAMAVAELLKNSFSRIVLCRPAVEAGEKLGFLPGDLAEKVNPYLRPLYDALHDMVDYDRARKLVERGTIEVAPLAFMRGRTLNDSFVILDEAQNTTSEQMKMFLTRLGYGSKAIITGDVTQIDLPAGKQSGLKEAQVLLRDVEGIRFVGFTERDVVRHPLVQQIITAYDRAER